MTSFILVKLGDVFVPVKTGGYEGAAEKSVPPDIAAAIERAERSGDAATLKELIREVKDATISDIKYGMRVWIPKEYVSDVPRTTTTLTMLLPDSSTVKLPVRETTPWSRGSRQVILKLPVGQVIEDKVGKLTEKDYLGLLDFGVDAFSEFTLGRTERKPGRESRRPTLRGMSGEVTIPTKRKLSKKTLDDGTVVYSDPKTSKPVERILPDKTRQRWIEPGCGEEKCHIGYWRTVGSVE